MKRVRLEHAFTVVELLVSLGVILTLTGMLLPVLGRSRAQTFELIGLSNARQMVTGLVMYAADHADLPPVFAPASELNPQRWVFDFGTLEREWFDHSNFYSLGVLPYLGDPRVARAPNSTNTYRLRTHRGAQVSHTDYHLTQALYAAPAFFNWETTRGRAQLGPQRVSSVRFPSKKGLVCQVAVYHRPEFGPVLACCMVDVPTPACFADLSAEAVVMRRMPPGFPNLIGGFRMAASLDPRTAKGIPILSTINGTQGVDR